MTTWTPATEQSETWTSEDPARRVFSQLIYSHAFYTSKRVFALGSSAGIYDRAATQAEVWIAN